MLAALTQPTAFWHLLTRLGEAQILLPAALLTLFALCRRAESRPLLGWWAAGLAGAVLMTTVSKVAFIGWGLGWPAMNFTGISGHAMFAAAVYPLLLGALANGAPTVSPRLSSSMRHGALACGGLLALLVGVSRVVVGAHSSSEVVAGLLLGGCVSAGALAWQRVPAQRISPLVPAAALLWLALAPTHAPASNSHASVTQLALALSGHSRPFTRGDMLKSLRASHKVQH